MKFFKFYIFYVYILFSILLYAEVKYQSNSIKNCISLIIPSTEKDFMKCYKQFFYNINSFIVASEIIIAISSVNNTSLIKKIVYNMKLKKKIILALRRKKHNAASNRNYGFMLSKCNIISYFDMDDIMFNNRLKIIYDLFRIDKTTEFVLHKYTTTCGKGINDIYKINNIKLKFNLSYQYIRTMYYKKYYKEISTDRWCCKYINTIKREKIHNGWPSMRRYIMNSIKYNISYKYGQDSDFNSNVILHGFNISLLNISLGYYKKDNTCKNYEICYK